MYEKQGFYSGQKLQASQLDAMEDGIINAEKLATEAVAGVANIEKGTGVGSTQQLQNQENGVTEGYFNFVGKNPAAIAADPSLNAELKYGAVGDYSTSFGGKSTAIGKRALSEGTTTVAKGAYSHAEGNNSVTLGANSHAEGKCTVTIGENSHSEGYETIAGEFNSHAEGYKTIAKGSAAHAEGQETKAYSHQSHTEGLRTVAGDETNPEIGAYAHAEGQDTVAKGEASHAAGIGTIAVGRAQTVVGRYNTETPDNEDGSGILFIVGNGNPTTKGNAFMVSSTGEAFMNYYGEATRKSSLINAGQIATVVEYIDTQLNAIPTSIKNGNGANSIVGGINSIADYNCDFTFGEGLSNTFEHQTVFGRYNDASNWGGNRPLFMIGNGTDADHRSNAFEVRNDGLVVVGNRVQQMPDGVADGFDFTGKNENATALDATLTGVIYYGARGNFSSSFGGKSLALGKRSHSEGTTTIAKGDYSHSEGNATVALGANAHAEGAITTAFGSTSHAEGQKTQAKGENSHAEGMSTITEGRGSHSEGFETKAIGNYSHAEGYGSQALHDESHASGYYTKTGMPMQTVCGAYNIGRDNTFFEIGNGNATKSENIFEVYTDGLIAVGNKVQQLPDGVANGFDFTGKNPNATTYDPTLTGVIPYGATGEFASAFGGKCAAMGKRSHAEGTTTIARGDYSHSEGNATVALGANSHAEGRQTVAAGNTAHAEGTNTIATGGNHAEGDSTKAEGYGSHAEGYDTYTKGGYSHAEGSGTKALGLASHAEGVETEAQAESCHAEGYKTYATGLYSHAEGTGTQAMGLCSHAEGKGASAQGDYSHSGGEGTTALGKASFAHGGGLRVNYDYQTVFGKWNKNTKNTLLEIGNGASEGDRLNIFEVYEDGDIGIYKDGKIYSLHKMLASYFTDANLK